MPNFNRIKKSHSRVAISIFAAVTAHSASGQPAERERHGFSGIEEIVVTSRRRTENLQDVPIAISAIGGEAMKARGISTTEDLMGAIPNIKIGSWVGTSTPNITVRGVGPGVEFNASVASPIGMYIDENYQAFRPAHGMQFFDLDRIEIVKGPQGTLYGRNTTGGAINVISNIPSLLEDTESYITAGFGNYSAYGLEGAFESTVIPNVLGVRIAGVIASADGYIKNRSFAGVNLTDQDFGETDNSAWRLTFRYQPTDYLDFVLKGYWGESDPIGAPPIVRPVAPGGADASGYSRAHLDKDEVEVNSQGRNRTKTKGATIKATVDAGPVVITSVSGYTESLYDIRMDCDGGPNNICNIHNKSDSDQFNQDLRFNFDIGRWDNVVGIYYGNEKGATNHSQDYFTFITDFFPNLPFNPPIPTSEAIGSGLFDPSAPITGIRARPGFVQETEAKAIYAESNYEISEAWTLTLGARYTEDEIDISKARALFLDADDVVRASTIPFSFPYDPTLDTLSRKFTSEEVTGRFIADYKFGHDSHVYASYSKGYRAGAINAGFYLSEDQLFFVDPEIIDAYELGVKSRFGDGKYQLNSSVFYYDYEGQQVQEVVSSIGFLRSLDGEVKGAEVEAVAQLTQDLQVNASLGVLRTEYNDGQEIGGRDVGGNSWPFAPELSFNINASWVLAKTNRGMLRLTPEAQYSDKFYYETTNRSHLTQDSYWLLSGRLSYENDSGFSISLWGKNLTDKFYAPWGADVQDFGVNYYVRGMPRTYGIEASIRF